MAETGKESLVAWHTKLAVYVQPTKNSIYLDYQRSRRELATVYSLHIFKVYQTNCLPREPMLNKVHCVVLKWISFIWKTSHSHFILHSIVALT